METKKSKTSTSLKPYDDSIWDQWNMYDNMPYVWDKDLCPYNCIIENNHNIIKFYRYQIKEPYEVKH